MSKKKQIKLPPREPAYETYALADQQRLTPWGTSIPTESGVEQMREWNEENKL